MQSLPARLPICPGKNQDKRAKNRGKKGGGGKKRWAIIVATIAVGWGFYKVSAFHSHRDSPRFRCMLDSWISFLRARQHCHHQMHGCTHHTAIHGSPFHVLESLTCTLSRTNSILATEPAHHTPMWCSHREAGRTQEHCLESIRLERLRGAAEATHYSAVCVYSRRIERPQTSCRDSPP
jgi:hypothetical protein